MSLAIAPTLERERHSRIDPPEITQKVQRRAYRAVSYVQALYELGKINDAEKAAADKLHRHWLGAQGVNVADGGGYSELDGEESVVYHGQQVQHARRHLQPVQWRAVIDTIEESRTLDAIGSQWLNVKNRPQSYVAGLALLKLSLAQVAACYGFG